MDQQHLESAKENLKEFRVIGILEEMELTMSLLKIELGWPMFNTHRNVNRQKPKRLELDRDTLEYITDINTQDIGLYEYGKSLFELQVERRKEIIKDALSSIHTWKNPYRVKAEIKKHLIAMLGERTSAGLKQFIFK